VAASNTGGRLPAFACWRERLADQMNRIHWTCFHYKAGSRWGGVNVCSGLRREQAWQGDICAGYSRTAPGNSYTRRDAYDIPSLRRFSLCVP